MGGRQTLSQESYFKSLCWTSSQALTRLSSMYIRKRMRSPQARLLVSCFRRLGLDLPLKPAGRESFCDSLGKPSRVEAQQPPWQHDLCVRSPITSATLHEPRQPAPRDESHTEALHPDAVPRPSWPEGPAWKRFLCSEFPPLSSWGHEIQSTLAWESESPAGAAREAAPARSGADGQGAPACAERRLGPQRGQWELSEGERGAQTTPSRSDVVRGGG